MEITSVYFTSSVDRSTRIVAPTDPDYADVVRRALHWTPVVTSEGYHIGYKSVVDNAPGIGMYTVWGNTQACEVFIDGCTNTADRRVRGYNFCLRCAQAFAEYTPDPVHIIDAPEPQIDEHSLIDL